MNPPQTQPVQPVAPLMVVPADNIQARPVSDTHAELRLSNAAVSTFIVVDKGQLTSLVSQLGMMASALTGGTGLIKPPTGLITP